MAKLRVNAAKARQARQDGRVDDELALRYPKRRALQARVESAKAERTRKDDAQAGVARAAKQVAEEETKLQRDKKRLPGLDGRMNDGFEALRGELKGLGGEWKVWFLVFGTLVAVLSSGVGNRLLNVIWPVGPKGAPVPGAPSLR